MLHSGFYSIDFILWLVMLFFLPAIIKNFASLLLWVRYSNTNSDVKQTECHLSRYQQWDMIVESAMIDAMSGNKSARDWVTKHVFSETEPQQSGIATTSREIIREAHDALKPLGYKPAELKDKIKDLCKDKIYTSADDLIQDIIRGA